MTLRLNARVDPELARKVKYLEERTGSSTTEVLKASLEAYYARVLENESPALLLKDFVGCAEGPSGLSSSYKTQLTDSLARKTAPKARKPRR